MYLLYRRASLYYSTSASRNSSTYIVLCLRNSRKSTLYEAHLVSIASREQYSWKAVKAMSEPLGTPARVRDVPAERYARRAARRTSTPRPTAAHCRPQSGSPDNKFPVQRRIRRRTGGLGSGPPTSPSRRGCQRVGVPRAAAGPGRPTDAVSLARHEWILGSERVGGEGTERVGVGCGPLCVRRVRVGVPQRWRVGLGDDCARTRHHDGMRTVPQCTSSPVVSFQKISTIAHMSVRKFKTSRTQRGFVAL